MQHSVKARVPAYALYGETLREQFPEALHIETIVVRSSANDWKIRQHLHQDLFQFFLVRQGGGTAVVEGTAHRLMSPGLIVLPPMTVHGFNFDPCTSGYVASIPVTTLDTAVGADTALREALSRQAIRLVEPAGMPGLVRIMEGALEEYDGRGEGRDMALRNYASLIAVGFGRRLARNGSGGADAGVGSRIVIRFLRLVEADFRNRVPLADYARRLGVSVTHLTRMCRETLGSSALSVVHDRIMLEARRNLVYTTMSVAEISEALGFSDPAYFSRFFTARTGARPTAFRIRERAG